jgi:hypothetical protein
LYMFYIDYPFVYYDISISAGQNEVKFLW